MDANYLLLWIVGLSSATTLFQILRRGASGLTSPKVAAAVSLLVMVAGIFAFPQTAGYAAGVCWFLFLLAPSLAVRRLNRLVTSENFKEAAATARWLKWLYPFDDWRSTADIYAASALAKEGSRDAAAEILQRYRHVNSPQAKSAVAQLYKIQEQWQDFLTWAGENMTPQEFERSPALSLQRLRALGETGQLDSLRAGFEDFDQRFHQLPMYPDLARACVLMFFGKTDLLNRLLEGPLSTLSLQTRERYLLKARAAEIRRATGPGDTPQEAALFARIESELTHQIRYSAPTPTALPGRPMMTYFLIGANVLVFGVQTLLGGSLNTDVAITMGALLPLEPAGGGWWRLFAASFLHFGVAHIGMNMLALYSLGPFVERILQRWRYLALYLGAGIGSMGIVVLLSRIGLIHYDLLAGASGSIMGLVGATAAIALRDSRILKTRAAMARLQRAGTIIAFQIVFDASTPQVSMAAHLGGALSGFLLALLLGTGTTGSLPANND